jgi:hypothetical protein
VTTDAPAAPARTSPTAVTSGAALVTAALVVLLVAAHGSPDVDLWLHLRVGEFLRAGGRFGLPDPFVALADEAYRPTQWLAEVLGSLTWDALGMPGIQVLRLLGVLALVGFTWASARAAAGATGAGVAAAVTAFASSAGWGERPQLLGLALLALVAWRWWRALPAARAPWEVVPVTWVWAGVHGSWAVGIGLGVAMALVALVDERHGLRRSSRMLLVPAVSCLAVALTPLGPSLLLDPFVVGSALRGRVAEWQPPGATNPLFLALLVAALVVVARWVRTRPLRLGRLLLLVATVAMAASAVRLLAVAAVLLAPLLAEALQPDADVHPPLTRAEVRVWAAALAVALAGGLWLARARQHSEPAGAPVATALDRLPAGSVVAADPYLAGWVEWRFQDLRLLRDLRSELYSPATAQAYEEFLRGREGAAAYADAHDVRAVVVRSDGDLARQLTGRGWVHAVTDDGYAVLLAPG